MAAISAAMAYTQITYTLDGPVAVISLNRPAVRNAISVTMTKELDHAFAKACHDHAVRCIVLRANGAHFSSGHDLGSDEQLADLKEQNYSKGPLGDVEKWSELDTEMCLRWRALPKPIVAGVKGYTIYHATALLAVADIAIAADDLQYMTSLIEYSALPWETALSAKKSKEILFTQRFVRAHEAAALGIVNHVVPAAGLDAALMRMARQVAKSNPMHVRMMKQLVNGAQSSAGFESSVRAGLSHWTAWRWHWTHANAGVAKTRDHGGTTKRLAPVKEAQSGTAATLTEEAEARSRL